jgi:hypothetical protein
MGQPILAEDARHGSRGRNPDGALTRWVSVAKSLCTTNSQDSSSLTPQRLRFQRAGSSSLGAARREPGRPSIIHWQGLMPLPRAYTECMGAIQNRRMTVEEFLELPESCGPVYYELRSRRETASQGPTGPVMRSPWE